MRIFRCHAVITIALAGCTAGGGGGGDRDDVVATAEGAAIRVRAAATFTSDAGATERAAEIVAYDPSTSWLWITNKLRQRLDIVDIGDPEAPTYVRSVDLTPYGRHASSVAVARGVVAATVVGEPRNVTGVLALFDAQGAPLAQVEVGAAPDMVAFTPDGRHAVVANEGEPSEDYAVDPVGSVSVVELGDDPAGLTQADVRTAGFDGFTADGLDGVRVYGPDASLVQDLEPEFVALADDGATAWVTLQENDAVAEVDVATATISAVWPLGTKDHDRDGAGFDASDVDDRIDYRPHPTAGLYMPDGVEAFDVDGETFLVTANEGAARSWGGFSEVVRLEDAALDPARFPNATALKDPTELGRLKVSTTGDDDGDGDLDRLLTFGGRSFTIWTPDGEVVWDSGDRFERIIANAQPASFNSDSLTNDSFDQRSDDSGPEPESVVVGEVDGRFYAFVAMERMSGMMVFEVSDPFSPSFVQYVNTRDFSGDPSAGTAGDLGPEGMVFVTAEDSPTNLPLVVVSYEGSGTTTVFAVEPAPEEAP